MAGKVDIKVFAKGYVTPASWFKSFGVVSKFLIIAGILWAIYVAFIKPWVNPIKTQTQSITVQKGATAIIQQKQEAPKKRFIPFVEVGVGQARNERLNTFVRSGVRFEW